MSDKAEGTPGVPRDEDDEVELGISVQAVANIIDAARASAEDEEEAVNEDVDLDEEDDSGDLTGENLEALIGELNEDEQAALIALTWVGRGDYEPDEWEEALALARERNEADTAGYLMGMEMLGDLLAEGLAAFGIVVEEIER